MNKQITDFLSDRIAANDFPSAVYLVAEKGEIVFLDSIGSSFVGPNPIVAKTNTVYDLASLTKPLVTGLLAAQLVERTELNVDRAVSEYLPGFKSSDKGAVTVLQLLSHTSGLPAWKPYYLEVSGPEDIPIYVERISPEYVADSEVRYSDLNFTALLFILEKIFDQRIDEAFRSNIRVRLGLTDTCYDPLSDIPVARIAASEEGNEYEKLTCSELGYSRPVSRALDFESSFRNYLIHGEVHDGNAWFMGGVAGHAGLFSTAEEVFKIALQFLPNYSQLLTPKTCLIFRKKLTNSLNEDRSFAFQLASTEGSTAGTNMSPQSFGHNGFTGTSLWIDPIKERIFILLTNRTHSHPLPFANINSVRRRFHDLAIKALDSRA